MAITVFLSPSNQLHNIGSADYGSEAQRMNQLCDIIEAELERCGIFTEREGNEINTKERVEIANKSEIKAYIAIHSNYNSMDERISRSGTEVYYKLNDKESARLGREIFSTMRNVDGFNGRGMSNNEALTEINTVIVPAVMVEVEYHDVFERACWIMENMYEIGVAIAKGILTYFNVKYKERDQQKYYRIQVGAFTSKEKAEKLARALINDGYPCLVKYY